MAILQGALGFLVTLLGRQFHWLFVGGAGTLVGIYVAEQLIRPRSFYETILIILAIGTLSALASLPMKHIMIGLAGFVYGGFLVYSVPPLFGAGTAWFSWIYFFVGGIVGAAFVMLWLDLPMIVISSIVGGALLAEVVRLSVLEPLIMFLLLVVFGIAVQLLFLQYGKFTTD